MPLRAEIRNRIDISPTRAVPLADNGGLPVKGTEPTDEPHLTQAIRQRYLLTIFSTEPGLSPTNKQH